MATSRISCHHDRTFIIDTDTTALIVIDMQRDFFADETGAFEGAMMDVVPRVESLLETCRAAGLAIVHTREGYASDMSDVSPFRESLGYVGRDGPFGRFLVRGEHGHDFLDSVRPLPGETVIDNHGLLLPPGTPPGRYTLLVGLYDLADPAARLEYVTPAGERGDALPLATITVP